MEPFCVGMDWLPVYMMSWNRSVQNHSFQCIHAWTVPKWQPLSLCIRNKKNSWKSFPTIHMFFKALPKIFFLSKFFNYRQLSSVEFPKASFLNLPDETGSGCLHENFLVRFQAESFSRWTSSDTASGSVWNGSISSRVNTRPIRTVLILFHSEPFPCKRGLSSLIKRVYKYP